MQKVVDKIKENYTVGAPREETDMTATESHKVSARSTHFLSEGEEISTLVGEDASL